MQLRKWQFRLNLDNQNSSCDHTIDSTSKNTLDHYQSLGWLELKLDLLATLGYLLDVVTATAKMDFPLSSILHISVPYTKFKTNVFYVIMPQCTPHLSITFYYWKAHFSKSSSTVSCDVLSVPSNRISHSVLCVMYVPSTPLQHQQYHIAMISF